MTNLEKFQKDLKRLSDTGELLKLAFLKEANMMDVLTEKQQKEFKDLEIMSFSENYERWYSESYAVIKHLLPDRLYDFSVLYKNDKRKEVDYLTYTISDALIGLQTSRGMQVKAEKKSAFPKLQQQIRILQSVERVFKSSLFNIKQILQAEIFDSEIESSKELVKKGFYRAAGAICGVLIEKYLQQVCIAHNISLAKKTPTISDFNDLLKNQEVYEISTWRYIQRLGDIRNMCSHNKNKEPSKEDVEELINGTEKIMKTIF